MAEKPSAESDPLSLERIDKIAKTLKNVSLGKPLIDFGVMRNIQVILDPDMETGGYFSESLIGDPEVYLNASCDDGVITASAAHELRHVEQSVVANNILASYKPMEAIMLNRILEADASAYSVAVAYQIFQETGDDSALKGLEAYCEDDIRDAFMAAVTPGKKIEEDMEPFRAAFNQWFKKPERVEHYDNAAIDGYISVKDSPLALLFNTASNTLGPETIEPLGVVTKEFNYLSGEGAPDVLAAPYNAPVSAAVQAKVELANRLT